MTFTQSISTVFSNYVTFSGRASRSEFWWWIVFCILVGLVTGLLDTILFNQGGSPHGDSGVGFFAPINSLASLILFLPGLAVSIRRLHDSNKSGWWWLVVFVPILGILLLIFWYTQPSTPGSNRFG